MKEMVKGIFQAFKADQGHGNCRCSGYALAPVLMDMDPDRWRPLSGYSHEYWGRYVYDRLVECQDRLLEQYGSQSASACFVHSASNVINGTCMILPSVMVSCCEAWGYGARMYYYGHEAGIFGQDILEEMHGGLGELACNVDGYEELEKSIAPYSYLMALTRFRHWVSLKKTSEGYFLYDPAPHELRGGMSGPDSFAGLLPVEYGHECGRNFDGLAIGITGL